MATPLRGELSHAAGFGKAKACILMFMWGGPSQLDLFDPKPKLAELSGKPMPESLTKGERVAQLQVDRPGRELGS